MKRFIDRNTRRLNKWMVLTLMSVAVLISFIFASFYLRTDQLSKEFSVQQQKPKIPLLLSWNTFAGFYLFTKERMKYIDRCPVLCEYTNNASQKNDATIIIFHMGVDSQKRLGNLQEELANSSAYRVFFNHESPVHRTIYLNYPTNFFHFTMSYREDSTVYHLYDIFQPRSSDDGYSDEDVEAAIAKKSEPALIFVSHCSTNSKRETIVKALNEELNVTQYGFCSHKNCPRDQDCEFDLIKTHYFYLAFENSVCNEYVTEKFWRLKKLIVPIVLDRSVFQGTVLSALHPYFIAVNDFPSIEALAAHLRYLMANHTAYAEYFSWTKKYSPKEAWRSLLEEVPCKLCQLAWDTLEGRRPAIDRTAVDLHWWWGTEANCKKDFGIRFISDAAKLK